MKLTRMFSLLLALVLLAGALPMAACAVTMSHYTSATHIQQAGSGAFVSYYDFDNGRVIVDTDGKIIFSSVEGYQVGDVVTKVKGDAGTYIAAHVHEYEWLVNRDGHGYRCACGAKKQFSKHTDSGDGTCQCGYKFMTNADLTVLWMRGIKLSPAFQKGVTEYEGTLTMQDLKETKISAFSFDAKATIELPEDLTLKDGVNTFQIKVTAEDGKTTQTYTVKVTK